jgi:hypothetical protein
MEWLIAAAALSWAGLSVLVIKACQQLATSSKEATKMYKQAAETNYQIAHTSLEELKLCKFFAEDVIRSYQSLGLVQKEMMDESINSSRQAASVCRSSVREVTETCEQAVDLAAKTCHEVLHAAFPSKTLDWSWHHENSFMCYFCQDRFPMTELDQQGQYKYCKEHGVARRKCS